MQIDTAILVGFLFGAAIYLILQSSFVRILFGFILLSNAANLLVLSMSGSPVGKIEPVVLDSSASMGDPLPQALVLTAIVIGFGIVSYLVFLLYRIFLDQKATNVADIFSEKSLETTEESFPLPPRIAVRPRTASADEDSLDYGDDKDSDSESGPKNGRGEN